MAKTRPKMAKTRPKMAKMRPKIAKMRPKMAKMRPKIAKKAIFEGPLTQNGHFVHAQACMDARTTRGDTHRHNGKTTARRRQDDNVNGEGSTRAALSRICAGFKPENPLPTPTTPWPEA